MNRLDPGSVPKFTLAGGEQVPVIGMGTFGNDRFSPGQVADAVKGAALCGYRFFDCAAAYQNEAEIGLALEDAMKTGGIRREELFVSSKVWNDMHGRGDVLIALAKSLKDLRLDYLDGYMVHWPFPNYHPPGCARDWRSPASRPFLIDEFMETWRQMERLVDAGLVRHIGVSNMTLPKLRALLPRCRIRPAFNEVELHPGFQQQELFEYCRRERILLIGFCPLGSPTRPARDRLPDDVSVMEMPAVREIAARHGVHPALICIKWAVRRGHMPIPFSVYEAEYESNLRCVTEDPLTDGEFEALTRADTGRRIIKAFNFLWPGAESWENLWDTGGEIDLTGWEQPAGGSPS
ncbi:MAG: aldo/keto reductase [Clostridia bacterium]|nr:aldo/keto reductase [Clostridia bacterium]